MSKGNKYEGEDSRKLNSRTPAAAIHPAELKPNDLTMVLTLSAKVLEVIFLPGTWNGFETASTYAEWNLLKKFLTSASLTSKSVVTKINFTFVLVK